MVAASPVTLSNFEDVREHVSLIPDPVDFAFDLGEFAQVLGFAWSCLAHGCERYRVRGLRGIVPRLLSARTNESQERGCV